MSIVLVDTDILINLLRGVEKAKLYVENAAAEGAVLCSVITVAEIYAGMKEREKSQTDALLDSLEVVDVTMDIARQAGAYKSTIRDRSLELDDCLIAATAHEMNAILATGNEKHYPMNDIRKDMVSFDEEESH
jgi:predicted nucleic acid-binding protein